MDDEYAALHAHLAAHGQEHVLRFWSTLTSEQVGAWMP